MVAIYKDGKFGHVPIIDDDFDHQNDNDFLFPKDHGRGYVERDYEQYPETMFQSPSEMFVIPESEWDARIEQKDAEQSWLSDIRTIGNFGKVIPTIDQGPNGYCWGHSVTQAQILVRASMNLPYVPLSAYAVCSIIKKGKNEGGWCGLAHEFMRDVGIPSTVFWPQLSRDLRLDTPAMRANAALHKVTEDWVDLMRRVWDKQLSFKQVVSCLLSNIPVALDFNWWAHSVAGLRVVKIERGSYGIEIWNSWGDRWGTAGTGILRGSKAIPNGAVALRSAPAYSRELPLNNPALAI